MKLAAVSFIPLHLYICETMTDDIQHEINDNDIDNVPSIKNYFQNERKEKDQNKTHKYTN